MSEELRVLLRNAIYMGTAAIVYWFVAYEWAGSVMMGVMVVAILAFVVLMTRLAKATTSELRDEQQPDRLRRTLTVPQRMLGLEEHAGAAHDQALAVHEERMPHGSIWPLISVVAIALASVGLVFGGWFWVIGLPFGLWALWGWATQLAPPSAATHQDAHASFEGSRPSASGDGAAADRETMRHET